MVLYKDNPFDVNENLSFKEDIEIKYKDVIEALYLARKDIMNELWDSYPNSILQFAFYKTFINLHPEYANSHPIFDKFNGDISKHYDKFLYRDEKFLKEIGLEPMTQDNKTYISFHNNIENRAKLYTNPLVKMGLLSNDRYVTPAGFDFINYTVERDELEKGLQISNSKIVLLRQLAKLRIFSRTDINGNIISYSPFNNLFTYNIPDNISDCNLNDYEGFSTFVRNLVLSNPYNKGKIVNLKDIKNLNSKISKEEFFSIIHEEKEEITDVLWEFYDLLYKLSCSYIYSDSATSGLKKRNICYAQLKDLYFSYNDIIKKYLFQKDKLIFSVKGIKDFEKDNCDSNWFSLIDKQYTINNTQFNEIFFSEYFVSSAIRLIKKDSMALFKLLEKLDLIYVFNTRDNGELKGDTFKIIEKYIKGTNIKLKSFSNMKSDFDYEGGVYSYFSKNQTLMEILNTRI